MEIPGQAVAVWGLCIINSLLWDSNWLMSRLFCVILGRIAEFKVPSQPRVTKISESRWWMAQAGERRLSLTKMRPGCVVTRLQAKLCVADSQADLHCLQGTMETHGWIKSPQTAYQMVANFTSGCTTAFRRGVSASSLWFVFPTLWTAPQKSCPSSLNRPFSNEKDMLGSRSLLHRQLRLKWFDLIYFSLFHDFAAVLNTEMVVPSSTSALSGIHWLSYPDSKSSQAKWRVTATEAVRLLSDIKVFRTAVKWNYKGFIKPLLCYLCTIFYNKNKS